MITTDVVQFALRLGLAGVFALAGTTKLFDADGFRQAFIELGGPRGLARAFSVVVPALELAVAVALVLQATAFYGAVGAVALLLTFTAAIGLAFARGRTPSCHCFGQMRATPVGWHTLTRNVALLSAAAAILALPSANTTAIAAAFGGLALSVLAASGLRFVGPAERHGRRIVSETHAVAAVPIDSMAPNFSLQELGGATVTLDALRAPGRPVLLFFLGPGCGQCGALVPEVSRWQREYDDVLTLALVSHGTPEINRAKFGRHELRHLLLQQQREVLEAYGAAVTPSAMVVRSDGTIGSALAIGDVQIRQLIGEWTGAPDDVPVVRTALTDAALTAFLRLNARLECNAQDRQRLADAAAQLETWQGLAPAAEAHGLAPLVWQHLRKAGVEPPMKVRRELLAVTMIHGAANRIRFRVLGEILDAFDRVAIPVVVLQGAALAHLLYSSVELRPLSRIDLLVAPEHAGRAQETLAALGFTGPLTHEGAVSRVEAGTEVWVEVRTNALPGDSTTSLTMSELTSATQAFRVHGRVAQALGHADMLHDLCRQVAEPAKQLRLIVVTDIIGYATRYRHNIPWLELRRRQPFVLDAISRLDHITPLPLELTGYVAPPSGRRIRHPWHMASKFVRRTVTPLISRRL